MEFDWPAIAGVVGALLVFAASIWRLAQEHVPLRRLERLAALRSSIEHLPEAQRKVDASILLLVGRVYTQSHPLGWEKIWAYVSSASAYAYGALSLVRYVRDDIAHVWPALVAFAMSGILFWAAKLAPARLSPRKS